MKKICSLLLTKSNIREYGIFSGYASVFNVIDRQNDIIKPGAFSDTIKTCKKVMFLWQHNKNKPIGKIINMIEDNFGLYITVKLILEIKKAEEVYLMIKKGVINSLSIGYQIIDYYIDKNSGARVIEKLDLWEVSLVTFPSNTQAQITNIKNTSEEQQLKILNSTITKAQLILHKF
ncbi:HK97 family phage prohead protease [Neoehrlichia mikurensis]|uniref:HK97 family phage prohead protease n=1 Tax=Neoehrlichia mikurensis TaxID=89586 RepID=A0A9Q9BWB3_9RICK|nr:HK97 family phage prohead protease [Neoehrlichia mikurensis]QXK92319.1 HK97 family phage prohead protease [Neoehrlichia mikurensis]QXK92773.1 HK97 family phage prohead protease [Neoehrlichia mikurensis]QXK94014.1 HK97 family phage prohead protease [Neoehrlichia mikurensis]UTO55823.1 HK97 family phage prohead protease [Neoehrlichia mikurensis]UTO56738.1 HK97 family phage prohead protease [Neoehrlichia mikurensis]